MGIDMLFEELPKSKRSKRLERCVYCGAKAESRDHSPPRCLLIWPPETSVKVLTFSACLKCNSSTSRLENLVSIVLALVGRHPVLEQQRAPGGKISRAFERDSSLKDAIEKCKTSDGNYELSGEVAEAFDRVIRKTIQGLYFGLYDQILDISKLSLIAIEHTDTTTPVEMVFRLRHDGVKDLINEPLPSITPQGLPNVYVVQAIATHINSGERVTLSQNVLYLPRQKDVEWFVYQEGTLSFTFFQGEDGNAICVLDLWGTLVCAVKTSWPSQRGVLRKGRKNPQARKA